MAEHIRTCFISSSAQDDTRAIRDALIQRGVQVTDWRDQSFQAGTDFLSSLREGISNADLVVAVWPPESSRKLSHGVRDNVIFELGLAMGMGKQAILFSPRYDDLIPSDLLGVQFLRTKLNNREAIDFAFDQILTARRLSPTHSRFTKQAKPRRSVNLNLFHDELRNVLASGDGRALENVVARALRETGEEVVVESQSPDRGIDLVVWSDALQPSIQNPLLIEIKLKLDSREHTKRALLKAAETARSAGSNFVMLVYGKGPSEGHSIWLSQPQVLPISADRLFDRLGQESLADIVLSLLNRRAYDELF